MEESIESIDTESRSLSPSRRSPSGERRSANRELFETHAVIKARMDAEKMEKTLRSPSPSKSVDHQEQNDYDCQDESSSYDTVVQTTEKPSYMSHTVCSLEHIRRDSIELNRAHNKKPHRDPSQPEQLPSDLNQNGGSKFGVELKRTNSQQSAGRRKSSSSEIPHIEEIYEIELLEKMLETVVGYEQRRRIRSQIRIVKKHQKPDVTNSKKTSVESPKTKSQPIEVSSAAIRKSISPTRRTVNEEVHHRRHQDVSSKAAENILQPEEEPDYSKLEPVVEMPMIRKNSYIVGDVDHTARISESKSLRKSSPVRKNYSVTATTDIDSQIISNTESFDDTKVISSARIHRIASRSPSPPKTIRDTHLQTTEIIQKTTSKVVKQPMNGDEKPIWATKNILKKASEGTTRTFKTNSTTASSKKTVQKVQKPKTVDTIEDCVTSSYGIGPTDDDGTPLFGIRALKKKNAPSQSTTKGNEKTFVFV